MNWSLGVSLTMRNLLMNQVRTRTPAREQAEERSGGPGSSSHYVQPSNQLTRFLGPAAQNSSSLIQNLGRSLKGSSTCICSEYPRGLHGVQVKGLEETILVLGLNLLKQVGNNYPIVSTFLETGNCS